MGSLFLNRLAPNERQNLIETLFKTQNGKCFICEEKIDLILHKNAIDVDHIIPISLGGKDGTTNFALTHSSCNRSKQASDLNLAKILIKFNKIRDSISEDENRSINLADILDNYGGSKYNITLKRANNVISLSLPEIGKNDVAELPIYKDKLSGFEFFLQLSQLNTYFTTIKLILDQ